MFTSTTSRFETIPSLCEVQASGVRKPRGAWEVCLGLVDFPCLTTEPPTVREGSLRSEQTTPQREEPKTSQSRPMKTEPE